MVCHASEPRYQSSLPAAQWQYAQLNLIKAQISGIRATGSGTYNLSAAPDAGAGAVRKRVLAMRLVTDKLDGWQTHYPSDIRQESNTAALHFRRINTMCTASCMNVQCLGFISKKIHHMLRLAEGDT